MGSNIDNPPQISRSTSATSSLDPYYFGLPSRSGSPIPALPTGTLSPISDSRSRSVNPPSTPASDPALVDRRALIGMGELATPRWARPSHSQAEFVGQPNDSKGFEILSRSEQNLEDGADSPWTIEAVDGESSEREEVCSIVVFSCHLSQSLHQQQLLLPLPPRLLRGKSSVTEESGGEEIVYPRKNSASKASADPQPATTLSISAPPSAFVSPIKRAKKRTSNEFEMDHTGSLVAKRTSATSTTTPERVKEEKQMRKHRSLNIPRSQAPLIIRDAKAKDRHRDSSTNATGVSSSKVERHAGHVSMPTSSHPDSHARRAHTTDFSHLPPSPSTSAISQFLRQPTASSVQTPPPVAVQSHPSPSVVHSLLRGTQEGWSGYDDEVTAEALRKLDGLPGKGPRSRVSIGSLGRVSSNSRPGTPPAKTQQWEGLSFSSETNKVHRRTSLVTKEVKDKELHRHDDGLVSCVDDNISGAHLERTTQKGTAGHARMSFTPKRGSTSSTTYISTPTASSRDSASLSAITGMNSVSATSRGSLGKTRRNSAGSDVSSIHSNDNTNSKDKLSDSTHDDIVPPVPPLPKDLSSYRSLPAPPMASNLSGLENKDHFPPEVDRMISLEVPIIAHVRTANSSTSTRRQSQHYSSGYGSTSTSDSVPTVLKTPSKKWSFTSALNLKLSTNLSSSSTPNQKSSFPLSPRGVSLTHHLKKSTSKEHHNSLNNQPAWSPDQPTAMTSAASLVSLSSVGSNRNGTSTARLSKTPEQFVIPSPSSSASPHHTISITPSQNTPLSPSASMRRSQSKRLTPSSIPFFRRGSSQSMQISNAGVIIPTSPTQPTPMASMSTLRSRPKSGISPTKDTKDGNASSTSTKKSSVLSLGLPSLLKGSSSRRSLHGEAKEAAREAAKEVQRAKEAEKERIRQEKERQKKEDKERSESRISNIIGRKRGKVRKLSVLNNV